MPMVKHLRSSASQMNKEDSIKCIPFIESFVMIYKFFEYQRVIYYFCILLLLLLLQGDL